MNRSERKAERENARRTAQAPLLASAGLVPLTTPAEVEARRGLAQEQDHGRLRVTIGGVAYEVPAPGPQGWAVVPCACQRCGAPLEVGAGMTSDWTVYQAHCRACMATVGTVEIFQPERK